MAVFSKEFEEKICAVLTEKGAMGPCSRCGNESFIFIQGFISPYIIAKSATPTTGNLAPSVGVVCSNCGFTALHNINILKLGNWGDEVGK